MAAINLRVKPSSPSRQDLQSSIRLFLVVEIHEESGGIWRTHRGKAIVQGHWPGHLAGRVQGSSGAVTGLLLFLGARPGHLGFFEGRTCPVHC